jgi:multidrug efflux pump subunit AcrB
MSLAGLALKRPCAIISLIMLACMPAVGAWQRMPTDIFPEIDIPVVSVMWTCNA